MRKHRPETASKSALILTCLVLALMLGLGSTAAPSPARAEAPARLGNSLGMEFVLIPAGSFIMGSPADEPGRGADEVRHQVTISKPFYLQTTEVTLKQWRSLMGRRMFGRRKGPADMPVTKISFFEVQDYIDKLNQKGEGVYRLPTEAEWEYACRAGTQTAYAFGPTITCDQVMFGNNPLKDDQCVAGFEKRPRCQPGQPARVASFPPNAWGLYDMHGNVWEWCSDWYGPYTNAAVGDPQGAADGTHRVRRGGSWYTGPTASRSANRNFANPAALYQTLGFRLVRLAD